MPIHVTCPKCHRALSLAGPLLGKRVKCPECGTLFNDASTSHQEAVQAAPSSGVPRPAPRMQLGTAVPRPVFDDHEEALARVRRPARGLMLTAILGMAVTCLAFVGFAIFFLGSPLPMEIPITFGILAIMNFISNSLIVYGANEMRTLGSRGMAMLACIVALLNIPNGCLFLTIPFGIWGLIVISHPDVATSFQSMSRPIDR